MSKINKRRCWKDAALIRGQRLLIFLFPNAALVRVNTAYKYVSTLRTNLMIVSATSKDRKRHEKIANELLRQ